MSFADLLPGQHASEMHDHWWWRPGWHVGQRAYTWHLTFPGQTDLHQLVGEYQAMLSGFPTLDLVPVRWLHLTMQGVGFLGETTADKAARIADAAAARLAELPRLELHFRDIVVADEAVVLPPDDEAKVHAVRDAIRKGIADVIDRASVPESADHYRPHVSVAYSNGHQDAAPLLDALKGVEPSPARVPITAASLIVIHRDKRVYEWETAREVPIGSS